MSRVHRRRADRDVRQSARHNAQQVRARALAALTAGCVEQAEALFARCVQIDAGDVTSLHDLGVVAARRGDHAVAVERFQAVLSRSPDHVDACLNMAVSLGDGGYHDEAIRAARRAIALRPRDPNAFTVLGHVLSLTEDFAGAAAACGHALALDPSYAPAHLRRARSMRQLGRFEESLTSCKFLLKLRPNDLQAQVELGLTLLEAQRPLEAEAAFRLVLARQPGHGEATIALSRCLFDTKNVEGAIAELDRGISVNPDLGRLHMLRGLMYQNRGDLQEALRGLKQAIILAPNDAVAYLNLGSFLFKSERYVEAVLFLEHAARLQPTMVEAYQLLAEAHRALGHISVTITLLEHAVSLAPERIDLLWMACWARMQGCAWQDYSERINDLLTRALAQGHTIAPFVIMAFGLSDVETHLWTRAWAEHSMPDSVVPLRQSINNCPSPRNRRIRVGYLSADFRGHATAALVAEVFRLQDRGRFEIFGYNIGNSDDSLIGRAMISGLDHMVELSFMDDREAALRIAADDLDILVDLKGYTSESRPAILAHRAAPVQVNYLGYPGSMGTKYIDYIVADPVVAPFHMQPYFDEAIVHLPHSYQPNDRRRAAADPHATREAHDLPKKGFVFCCFNANYKLTPLVFSVWMRLLRQLPGSVIWLLKGNELADVNLRAAALAEGIADDRIVFAPRVPYDNHLGRLGLADLFLDTLPVNAHTTASEALWCGVPVLTCMGSHFTSRVAASLLTAVGLSELITTSLADYEREALALARDPARLGALRERLAANRDTAPLFDTPRYVRNYETALKRMVEHAEAGLAPRAFAIDGSSPASDSETLPFELRDQSRIADAIEAIGPHVVSITGDA